MVGLVAVPAELPVGTEVAGPPPAGLAAGAAVRQSVEVPPDISAVGLDGGGKLLVTPAPHIAVWS